MLNLAVFWLKLVCEEKVNPMCMLRLCVHVCTSEFCTGLAHYSEKKDARCEVIRLKNTSKFSLHQHTTKSLRQFLCTLANTHSGSSDVKLDELQGGS